MTIRMVTTPEVQRHVLASLIFRSESLEARVAAGEVDYDQAYEELLRYILTMEPDSHWTAAEYATFVGFRGDLFNALLTRWDSLAAVVRHLQSRLVAVT